MGSACIKNNDEEIIDDEGAISLDNEENVKKDDKYVVDIGDAKNKGNCICYCKENRIM